MRNSSSRFSTWMPHTFSPCRIRIHHQLPPLLRYDFWQFGNNISSPSSPTMLLVACAGVVCVLNYFAYQARQHLVGQSASRLQWPEPNKCISFDYDNEIDEHCMQISLSSSLAACCCWCSFSPKIRQFRIWGPGDKVAVDWSGCTYACTHYISRIFSLTLNWTMRQNADYFLHKFASGAKHFPPI